MYIRPKRIKGHTYWCLVRGHREGERVIQTVIRYLGKNPWGYIRPVRFKPPERAADYPRVLAKMRDRFIDPVGSPVDRDDLYSLALSLGETWFGRYDALKSRLQTSQSDPKLQKELGRIGDYVPDRHHADLSASSELTLAHLTALCLTEPGTALHFRHAAAWLQETLYQEPDIREAISQAHLWHLVDRQTGKNLSPKTFDHSLPAYSGPVDKTTKVVLKSYAIIQAGREGYRLRGKRGAEFLLIRKAGNPTELSVRAVGTNKPVPILGFRRFTDQGGELRPVL